MNHCARCAVTAAIALAFVNCSAASQNGSGTLPFDRLRTNAAHRAVRAQSPHMIYVSSQTTGAVEIYSSKGQGQAPIGSITDGISAPTGLAVDSSGNVYVANSGNNTVTVYPPGQTTPSTTYTQGISAPMGVAVGSDGTVYVANETGGPSGAGSITEYPAGSTTPSLTISLPNEYAYTLALDSSNALYVSWFSLSSFEIAIYKYPTEGSSTGSNLNLTLPGIVFPAFAIAFDHHGNLVVPVESLAHTPPKYLAVFAPGATKPKRRIREDNLLDVVNGIAFPAWNSKVVYVAGQNTNDWLKLTYPHDVPRDVVEVDVPLGLALSP